MSYIDRNEQNQIVGVFANQQYEGQEYLEGAQLYVPPPSPLEQIRALEAAKADASAKVVRQTLLRAAVEKAMERPEVVAMLQDYPAEEVKAQVISTLVESDPGFKLMWELEQAVKPLRAQIT
jgi:hypothetical protein